MEKEGEAGWEGGAPKQAALPTTNSTPKRLMNRSRTLEVFSNSRNIMAMEFLVT